MGCATEVRCPIFDSVSKFPVLDQQENLMLAERARLKEVYRRRTAELDPDKYAPWQPGEMLMLFERKRVASELLVKHAKFPTTGTRCVEIGYGKLGWLGDLISWGVDERSLFGIELDDERASVARGRLPMANLVIGDASTMPWDAGQFDLVIMSTVLSSISDTSVWKMISAEIDRVLSPTGSILLYDVAVQNPRNKDLRPISRKQIFELFPHYKSVSRSLTLAPSVARFVAEKSWALASVLSALPFARTHRLTLLTRS